jgi:CBS domain containing-hemolysin-like protein
LVGLNGFFVAAEFALVAIRGSRVRQLVEEGDARAKVVQTVLEDLDRVLSGVQVGITFASLGLGYVGQVTLADLFRPLFAWIPGPQAAVLTHGVAMTLAFAIITFMHVVLGELVPKSLSLQRPERIALLVARPLLWFLKVFSWPIDFFDAASQRIVRLMGVANPQAHTLVHSAEELLILIQQARERGLLELGEEKFIQSAMELSQVQVREIMVPRPDMHVLSADAGLEEVMALFATTQRSRIPVYEETPDHFIGFVHIKDMLWVLLDRDRRAEEGLPPPPFNLRRILRELLIVPETKPASELLIELRARRTGMALVVDEFGSILGLVAMEDILEQMVGEIHDEFDVIERPLTLADGAMVFDAAMNVRDLETQYNIHLPEDSSYETVGGFVLNQLGFIPRGGETLDHGGARFTVVEMDRRRIARVKIQRLKPEPAPAPTGVETGKGKIAEETPKPRS